MVAIGFLSISFTAPLHAEGNDTPEADHDASSETTKDKEGDRKVADTVKTGAPEKPKTQSNTSPVKTDNGGEAKKNEDEKRKISLERIRAELTELNDPGLLKLWSSLTNLNEIDLAKFKELVLTMPATNADKKKDEEKKEKLVKLFEKEKEALGASPLKEFQRAAAEIVQERFNKKITEGTATPSPTPTGAPGGVDKAKADADKKAAEEAAKLAAKKAEDSKKAEDAKKADEASKLAALDPKAAERKALGDALRNALGQAGQGEGQGQGAGSGAGSGSGDSGKGSGDSGGGDTGSKNDLAKNDISPNKKDRTNKNNNNSSTSSVPSTPDTEKKTTKEEKKAEPLFADTKKEEPKKTATPEPEAKAQPTTPTVSEAGALPTGGKGSSRRVGSLGQGTPGQVVNGGSLSGGPDLAAPTGPGSDAAGKVQSSNAKDSSGLDPSYLNGVRGAVPRDPGPTTTGYNMIKVAPGEWQQADGGAGSEIYGLDSNYEGSDTAGRKPTYASSSPVGFPSPDRGSSLLSRSPSSAGRAGFIEADGVFKKRNEWAGGEGLCLGGMKNLIGPCGKVLPKGADGRI